MKKRTNLNNSKNKKVQEQFVESHLVSRLVNAWFYWELEELANQALSNAWLVMKIRKVDK